MLNQIYCRKSIIAAMVKLQYAVFNTNRPLLTQLISPLITIFNHHRVIFRTNSSKDEHCRKGSNLLSSLIWMSQSRLHNKSSKCWNTDQPSLCKTDKCIIILEVVYLDNGLSSTNQVLMGRMETIFMDAIRRSVHADLQDFIQISLRDPLRKVIKKKEKELVRR